jgi:type VI secretion system protein ImpJ
MTVEHPTVWDEGMLLVPQHFQQQDRAARALLRDRLATLHPHGFGITSLDIDEEALRAGEMRVVGCSGVLRSGLVFRAPDRDPLPASRNLTGRIDARAGKVLVYLGVPRERLGTPACSGGGEDESAPVANSEQAGAEGGETIAMPTPYKRTILNLPDANLPTSERDVPVAVPNLRVLLETEPLEEYETLPIARVSLAPTGGFDLDKTFLPPCLHIGASKQITAMLGAFVEMLSRRSSDLSGQQGRTGGSAESATLWLRHTLNSHLPALMHYHEHPRTHPEVVYLELLRLAGSLCTFAQNEHPRDLPRYAHEDLGGSVGRLEQKLRHLLGAVIPNRCIPIPLDRPTETLFAASFPDVTMLDGQLYLAVGAELDEDVLLKEFTGKAKITSRELVQQLLVRAVPGLPARHVPTPPSDVPVQAGRHYFRLDKDGEHWEAIKASLSIGIHLPPTFPGLKVELMSVQEAT